LSLPEIVFIVAPGAAAVELGLQVARAVVS
jgi:hypothetical protein